MSKGKGRAWTKDMIEREARELRKQVLMFVRSRIPNAEDARQYLHPKYAFEMLGVAYEERPDLDMELRVIGEPTRFKRSVIAGWLDRRDKVVATSESSPLGERRFTAGHELGHWMLHEEEIEHRDRPIDVLAPRPPHEREADEFSAAYLMPPKWISKDLEERYGKLPIRVDEDLAWWLDKTDVERLLKPGRDADRERAIAITICTNIGRGHFSPMRGELYGVTAKAMAKRLMELDLIERA